MISGSISGLFSLISFFQKSSIFLILVGAMLLAVSGGIRVTYRCSDDYDDWVLQDGELG